MLSLPTEHHEQLEKLATTYWWHRHRIEMTDSLFQSFSPPGPKLKRYVDFGGGTGATTIAIASRLGRQRQLTVDPEHVSCVEPDAQLAALQREKPIRFVQRDLESGALNLDGQFDLFTLLDVIEHLTEPVAALKNIRASLAAGATGVVTVPAYPGLYSEWDSLLGHKRRYTRTALEADCKSAGFKILWCSFLFSFALPAAWFSRKQHRTTADFPQIPNILNMILTGMGKLETAWTRMSPVPFGTSICAVLQN